MTDRIARSLALQGRTSLDASGVARFIRKMKNGQAVKVTFIGDSIGEGYYADTMGVDDYASLVCTELSLRFGVTVTKSNRAISGCTVATFAIRGYWPGALADKSDLYVISFGHNDIRSDISTPGTGYPKAASVAGIEHMIRRIFRDVPGADFLLLLENPYQGGSSSNSVLTAYNSAVRELANRYGIVVADGYQAFMDLGNSDSLYHDTGHPSSAGHRVLADVVLKYLPSTVSGIGRGPVIPDTPLYVAASGYDRLGWQSFVTQARNPGADGWLSSGFSGTGPWVSSTPGSAVDCYFTGHECTLQLDTGAGSGVVDIYVDGVLTYASVDLTVFSAGQYRIPITGLAVGIHAIHIVAVSGTTTWRGFDALHTPIWWANEDNPAITFTGTWAQTTNLIGFYGGSRRYTSVTGDSFAFDFVGTGCGINMYRRPAGATLAVTVDGVAQPTVDTSCGGAAAQWGAAKLVSGLPYGRHSVTVAVTPTGGSFQLGGAYAFDEKRLVRPRVQRGVDVAGQVVKFPVPFGGRPAIRLSGNGVYPTLESATGFTVSGTAGQLAIWEAEGDLVAY